MHPRYLSVIALVFVTGWVVTTLVFKRLYPGILLDLISKNMLDMKSLEEKDVSQLFQDRNMQAQLADAFSKARGSGALWYGRLMKSLGMKNLDDQILSVVASKDEKTQIGLLNLLSSEAGEKAIPFLKNLVSPGRPEVTRAAVAAANRLSTARATDFLEEIFEHWEDPETRARAVVGLYPTDPGTYGNRIDNWLASGDAAERRAGILAAGGTGRSKYVDPLKEILKTEEDEKVIALALEALHRLEAQGLKEIVSPFLGHPSPSVRRAALEAFQVSEDEDIRALIPMLGDGAGEIQALASQKLQEAPHHNPEILIEALSLPDRDIREGLFGLLGTLEIKEVDVFRCARSQIERAYRNLAEAEALSNLPEGAARDLLVDHLLQKKDMRVETVLRVLAAQDVSGRMRIIWRGIFSADPRQRSNAIEALEGAMDRSLSKHMIPLIEGQSTEETLAAGRKAFQLPRFDSDTAGLYSHLLAKYDWVTVILTLNLIHKQGDGGLDPEAIEGLRRSGHPHLVQMVEKIGHGRNRDHAGKEKDMESQISIPDKILHLRGIRIFEGLSVSELAAIASITEEVVHPQGTDIIREGEQGETMYMITDGEVSVIKGREGENEIELDRIGSGGYFGEMALFEDQARSATIQTVRETRLLVLHKQEFNEIVREYPQIALHICRELSHRLRRLHEKVQRYERLSNEAACEDDGQGAAPH